MQVHRIHDPMFGLHLSLIEGTAEEFENVLKEENLYSKPIISQAHTVSDGSVTCMWIRDLRKRKWEDAMAILAHEITHLAFYVDFFRGVPINKDTDEVAAYYTEMVMRNILRVLKETKKNVKTRAYVRPKNKRPKVR